MKKQNIIFFSILCAIPAFSGCRLPWHQQAAREQHGRAESYREYLSVAVEPSEAAAPQKDSAGQQLPRLTGALSMSRCLQTALDNNLSLQSKEFARQQAEAVVKQATAGMLPKLSLSADTEENHPAKENSSRSRFGLDLTQPLWRGGALFGGIRGANMLLIQAACDLETQCQSILYDASLAYLNVALEQQLVAVYQSALEVAERMLETAKSKRARGTASQYEVLRGEVEVSNAKSDLIQEQNALEKARIELFRVMGVSQESAVALSDTLESQDIRVESKDAAIRALETRSELTAAHAALMAAKEDVRVARSAYSPELDFFGRGSYAEDDASGDWDDEWTFGLMASFRIFDGFEREGKVEAAKARQEQARTALYMTEQEVLSDVEKALMQLRYASEFYESQQKNHTLAQEMQRIAESGFKAGRTTQVEVLDARAAVTEAVGSYHQALYVKAAAALQLKRAVGELQLPSQP